MIWGGSTVKKNLFLVQHPCANQLNNPGFTFRGETRDNPFKNRFADHKTQEFQKRLHIFLGGKRICNSGWMDDVGS